MTNQEVMLKWEAVIDKLRRVTMKKIQQYGTSRYDGHSDGFNLWMCFSDVYRKTLRLENLTVLTVDCEDHVARAKLIDDYKDIANYAIMAVQILEEKDDGV